MKHSKLVLVAVVLGAAAVCWGVGGTASLAGFRLGEVIDNSSAAALKARGLEDAGAVSFCPEEKRFDYYKVIAPPEGLQDVYVYVSTNREVVRVSAEAPCRPGETAEGLKEKWLERFRDAMAPDGQNLLTIYACPSGSTNEPAIVYLDLRNAAADRSHLFRHPQPAK